MPTCDYQLLNVGAGLQINLIDFDPQGNIYCTGRNTGLFFVKADGSLSRQVGTFKWDIRALRVYNGYVYFAARRPPYNVYRVKILDADGNVGGPEKIFDLSTAPDHSGY